MITALLESTVPSTSLGPSLSGRVLDVADRGKVNPMCCYLNSYCLVPIFDLRKYDFSKPNAFAHINLTSGIPIWPHYQPHKGSIVVVCYTLGEYVKDGQSQVTVNFNILWAGVLKGDDTRDK